MGVTLVCHMPVAEGKNVQQPMEFLTRKLELLGAEKQGTFCVDCETYHTVAKNDPCLIADTNFDVLKGYFQNAKANQIKTRGTHYQYCDFLVKMGTVTTQR